VYGGSIVRTSEIRKTALYSDLRNTRDSPSIETVEVPPQKFANHTGVTILYFQLSDITMSGE
jgi:hypothetical protein